MTSLKSKRNMCQISLALLIIVTALLSTGCVPTPPFWWFERTAITTDEAGGAIVFYALEEEEPGQRRFYVQRVDKEGNFLWGEGVLVGRGRSQGPDALEIVSDQRGGAIVAWTGVCAEEIYAIHIARVGPQGEVLWQRQLLHQRKWGFTMPLVVRSDGSGGIIIGCGLSVRRIDAEGQFLWGEDGIAVPHHNGVVTEKGSVILVWEQKDGTILAQKISSEGEVLWPGGGVQVGLSDYANPQVTTDGLGGAIIAWTAWTKPLYIGCASILAQRIDAQGDLLWEEGRLVYAPCPQTKVIGEPEFRITASGAGEAIITVDAFRTSPIDRHIFAQKIDSQGNLKWQEHGVVMSSFEYGGSPYHHMVTDNADGGILVFYYYDRGVRRTLLQAQGVDAEGKVLWPDEVLVTTAVGGPFSMAPDGDGGVFVAWLATHKFGPLRSYIQRISAEGERMWGDKGILLNP